MSNTPEEKINKILDEAMLRLNEDNLPAFLQISRSERVTNVKQFIESHIKMIEGNKGKRNRLLEVFLHRLYIALIQIRKHHTQ